jgi:hypothetical protein
MSFRDDIKAGAEADHAEIIKSDDPPEGTTKGVHNVSTYLTHQSGLAIIAKSPSSAGGPHPPSGSTSPSS